MRTKPKKYFLTVGEVPKELHDKVTKMAEVEDRSVSAVIRRLISEAPEPKTNGQAA